MQLANTEQLRDLLTKIDEIDCLLREISERETYRDFSDEFTRPLRKMAEKALLHRESRLYGGKRR